MRKILIDNAVFDQLPDYCVGVVVANGINNKESVTSIQEMMDRAVEAFAKEYAGANIREIKNIDTFRQAFYKLNMNPNKFMCSIEALAKRAQKSGVLPHINTVVDLGNAMSVKYVLPMGAHDIDKLEADLAIRFSRVEDTFLPLGEGEVEQMPDGELVYASAKTVKTRRWIWRQSDDGKITEESTNLVFPIDGFVGINDADVLAARDELAAVLKTELNCKVKVGLLKADSAEMEL